MKCMGWRVGSAFLCSLCIPLPSGSTEPEPCVWRRISCLPVCAMRWQLLRGCERSRGPLRQQRTPCRFNRCMQGDATLAKPSSPALLLVPVILAVRTKRGMSSPSPLRQNDRVGNLWAEKRWARHLCAEGRERKMVWIYTLDENCLFNNRVPLFPCDSWFKTHEKTQGETWCSLLQMPSLPYSACLKP